MAGRLISITSHSPGVNGLNLEAEVSALGPEWATTAENCHIHNSGKLVSRQGWSKLHSSAITNTPDVEQVFEYRPASASNVDIICADAKIFKDSTNPTAITPTVAPTNNNWKLCAKRAQPTSLPPGKS